MPTSIPGKLLWRWSGPHHIVQKVTSNNDNLYVMHHSTRKRDIVVNVNALWPYTPYEDECVSDPGIDDMDHASGTDDERRHVASRGLLAGFVCCRYWYEAVWLCGMCTYEWPSVCMMIMVCMMM